MFGDDLVCVCRDGFVTLQEYMAFMISRETENVQSAQDVEAAFRALTSNERPYIQAQELYSVSYHSNEIIAIASVLGTAQIPTTI